MLSRQQNSESCPLPRPALDSDLSMMILNNTMTDRQSQAGPFASFRLRCVKRLKDMIDFFWFNTCTGIINGDCNSLSSMRGCNFYHSSVLQTGVRCVVQQIQKDLFDLVRNRRDLWQALSVVQYRRNPFMPEVTLESDLHLTKCSYINV